MHLPALFEQKLTNPSNYQAYCPDERRHVRLKKPEDAHHTSNEGHEKLIQREPIRDSQALVDSVQARVPYRVHAESVITTTYNAV